MKVNSNKLTNNLPNGNQHPSITEDMPVIEVVLRWPATIPIFLKYRTACVGCSMAVFETLGSAAQNYHLPLQQFMIDIEQAANTDQSLSLDSDPYDS